MASIAPNVEELYSQRASNQNGKLSKLRNDGMKFKVRFSKPDIAFLTSHTTGYSQIDRDAVEQMGIDANQSDNDVADVSYAPPPGEEGFDISHEGGEFEVFDELARGLAESKDSMCFFLRFTASSNVSKSAA